MKHPEVVRTSKQPNVFFSSKSSDFQVNLAVSTLFPSLWWLGASLPVLFSTRVPSFAAPTPADLCPGGQEVLPSPGSSSSHCDGSATVGP